MPSVITLRCPSCGGQIEIPDDSNRFTCQYCGNQHLLQFNVQPAPAKQAIRPRVLLPSSIQVQQDKQSARIIRRWWSGSYLFLAFFTFAWDAFLVFWYTTVTVSGAPWIFMAVPIIHLAVGVYLTYSVLAGFLNRTVVELTREELAVWHEPLPWTGERTIKTADIKQLYCKEHIQRTKNGPRHFYELFAVTQDDLPVKLLSKLSTPDLAQFFEQQLETWLRISDQPVVGEIAK